MQSWKLCHQAKSSLTVVPWVVLCVGHISYCVKGPKLRVGLWIKEKLRKGGKRNINCLSPPKRADGHQQGCLY